MMTSNRVTIGISNISITFFYSFSRNSNVYIATTQFFFKKIPTIYNPNKSTFKRNTCYCDFRFERAQPANTRSFRILRSFSRWTRCRYWIHIVNVRFFQEKLFRLRWSIGCEPQKPIKSIKVWVLKYK